MRKGQGLREIQERCAAARIPCTLIAHPRNCGRGRARPAIRVEFPALGGRASIVIEDSDGGVYPDYPILPILESRFECVIFLAPYVAIFDRESGAVEAMVETDNLYEAAKQMDDDPHESISRDFPARAFNIQASIGGRAALLSRYSDLLSALCHSDDLVTSALSLKLSVEPGSTAEQALAALESACNGLFFELDRRINVPFWLARFPEAGSGSAPSFRDAAGFVGLHRSLGELKATHLSAPMTLYWHARRAWRMPLLHFVGLYQVLEYFFPRFSNAALRDGISAIVRDPDFRPEEERCVASLAALVRAGGKRSYGDERAQLRDTIRACATRGEVRAVLVAAEWARQLFEKNALALEPLDPDDSELLSRVADRLYEVRCRIVHTKSAREEDASESILPGSEESGLLAADIALVRWMAERVLLRVSES